MTDTVLQLESNEETAINIQAKIVPKWLCRDGSCLATKVTECGHADLGSMYVVFLFGVNFFGMLVLTTFLF